jgi:transcriptional regulator with XRE-family HTH domain
MKPCQTELGAFIRARRMELGLSQESLAKVAGLQASLIGRFETGWSKRLSSIPLEKLALALQCESRELSALNPPYKQATTEFARFVQARAKELGLSLREIATRLGRNAPFKTRDLTVIGDYRTLNHWARALKCNPSNLEQFLLDRGFKTVPSTPLGRFVRIRRRELGLNLSDLAKALGVSRQAVSYIEMGETSLATKPESTARLAHVLQVTIEELTQLQMSKNN